MIRYRRLYTNFEYRQMPSIGTSSALARNETWAWIFSGTTHYHAPRIIVRKFASAGTIGIAKMWGNFVEISFQAKFP